MDFNHDSKLDYDIQYTSSVTLHHLRTTSIDLPK